MFSRSRASSRTAVAAADGLAATRELARAGSSTSVLILTTFDLDEYVYEAMKGVTRVLRKLALRDRAQAVALAYEAGLLQPGEP